MTFRPMTACEAKELTFPLYASPKIDGIRAFVRDGILFARSMKPIPNRYVQEYLGRPELEGLDGELTVGPAFDHNVMQATMSGVMSHDGEPDFTFHVFDIWNGPPHYCDRYKALISTFDSRYFEGLGLSRVNLLTQWTMQDQGELDTYEAHCLQLGYEGVMVRKPSGLYKHGRSTAKEGHLLKVKRFVDAEAVVIGFKERMHNVNEAKTNALGYTERSSHKAGKVPMGTLGALMVRNAEGEEFDVGTGFSDAQRAYYWAAQSLYLGKTLTYKSFKAAGVKDAPRFPVFKSWRDPIDIGDAK
jgi:DNA ligase-1